MQANIVPDYVDEQDYEFILASYLGNVRDDVDKREGSIIWDSGAPCCIEIAKAYYYLQAMILNCFASTATSPYLEWRCEEQGITRDPATYAKRLGTFTNGKGEPYAVPLGTEFSTVGETNLVNFRVVEVYAPGGVTKPGSYILQCTETGIIGNQYSGEIVPVLNLNDLATATLTDVLIPGEEIQDLEDLRREYFEVVNNKPFGGNITEYRQLVNEIEGVGGCQIYPAWQGGGTVLISIIDSSFNSPSPVLIEKVQTAVDPHYKDEYAGKGLGMAPIDHVVTIVGSTDFEVDVVLEIEVQKGFTLPQIQDKIKQNVEAYFLSVRQNWERSDDLNNYQVRVIRARIMSAALNTIGVDNITTCTLNGKESDLTLTENKTLQQVPKVRSITINE